MSRPNRALVALALAAAVFAGSVAAFAQQAPAAPASTTKWVDTVRGPADVQFLKPVVKNGKDKDGSPLIVSTIQVKNMSQKAIARLTIEEFWYDKAGNPVSGDKEFLRKPLLPGETATIVLETPKLANMDRNSYKFSHGNGDVKPKQVPKF